MGRVLAQLGRGGRGHQGQKLSPPCPRPVKRDDATLRENKQGSKPFFPSSKTHGYCPGIFVGISKGPKSTEFEQKAWATAHGFEQMEDFGKCWKSSQTANVIQMVTNGLLRAYGTFREDLGKIHFGPKSTDFEKKAWAMAHDCEDGGFW